MAGTFYKDIRVYNLSIIKTYLTQEYSRIYTMIETHIAITTDDGISDDYSYYLNDVTNVVHKNDENYSNYLVEYTYRKEFTIAGIDFYYNSLFDGGPEYHLFLFEEEYNKISRAQESIIIK